MENNSWKIFETTGKIEDYLKYAKEKKVDQACERFVSVLEGKDDNGRNNDGSGNSDFRNANR